MEIERKFLVDSDGWKPHAVGAPTRIVQSYFPDEASGQVSIRYVQQNNGMHALIFKQLHSGKELGFFIPHAEFEALGATGKAALFDADGYMHVGGHSAGRVRFAGERAYITLKAESGEQGARHELEFPIWPDEGLLLEQGFATHRVEKDRYVVPAGGGLKWEVDVFKGANAPLVNAEIELPAAAMHFVKPAWLGADVTEIGRYTNAALAQRPYSQWSEAEKMVSGGLVR